MVRPGQVVSVQKDCILVKFTRLSACKGCGGCVAAMKKEALIPVRGTAQPGDYVAIEMPDAHVVKASVLMYIIPLVGFLLGLLLGSKVVADNELFVAAFGLAGMLLCAGILALIDRRLSLRSQWQPQLKGIITQHEAETMALCEQSN
ncbi:MAG: SoxR reducing system RseC family protein [Christensenellales bacterium]